VDQKECDALIYKPSLVCRAMEVEVIFIVPWCWAISLSARRAARLATTSNSMAAFVVLDYRSPLRIRSRRGNDLPNVATVPYTLC